MKFQNLILVGWIAVAFSFNPIQAAIVVQDPFDDGGRTNGADPLDAAWFEVDTAISTTVNSQVESAIDANGLFVDPGASLRPIVAAFPLQTLNVGDSLRLSFDFRIFTAATTATSTTPTAQTSDGDLRFGLFNTNGSLPTADGSSTNAATGDFGYRSTVPVGAGPAVIPSLLQENGTATSILSGTDSQTFTSLTNTSGRYGNMNTGSVAFTITRTDTGNSLENQVFDAAGLSGTLIASSTAFDLGTENNTGAFAGIFTQFDEIAFSTSVDFNFRIDNVTVEYVAVPEPGTVVLTALGMLSLIAIRRRASW